MTHELIALYVSMRCFLSSGISFLCVLHYHRFTGGILCRCVQQLKALQHEGMSRCSKVQLEVCIPGKAYRAQQLFLLVQTLGMTSKSHGSVRRHYAKLAQKAAGLPASHLAGSPVLRRPKKAFGPLLLSATARYVFGEADIPPLLMPGLLEEHDRSATSCPAVQRMPAVDYLIVPMNLPLLTS